MSNEETASIFKNILATFPQIKEVSESLQDATKSQVVFYKLYDDKDKIDLFLKRLQETKSPLVITNLNVKEVSERKSILSISDSEFLELQKLFIDQFYPTDFSKFKLIAVTGTNGKTTTVSLATQIASIFNIKSISIGTLGVCDNNKVLKPTVNTTPSYIFLRKIFYQYQNTHQAFFLELSSHALHQKRFYKLLLDVAAWTNFTQDHLDYHKTMKDYFQSKKLIFQHLKNNAKIFFPSRFKEERFSDFNFSPDEKKQSSFASPLSSYNLKNIAPFFKVSYNQENLELAIALYKSISSDFSLEDLNKKLDLNFLILPPGRFSIQHIKDESFVVIDYAHTPDALGSLLRNIKKSFPQHKITSLFGCGGNRDKDKRPLMGKIAQSLSDKILITSDNPRFEDPMNIIADILSGIDSNNKTTFIKIIENRKEAILSCLNDLGPKEILLIAGKGHEEAQEIQGIKHSYSDFQVIEHFKNI